ncbi:hypothetical protein KKF55_05375 [Patescibacteria group bacterium]|nr:hypothetical protein [Patescibacteria group bacterium]
MKTTTIALVSVLGLVLGFAAASPKITQAQQVAVKAAVGSCASGGCNAGNCANKEDCALNGCKSKCGCTGNKAN